MNGVKAINVKGTLFRGTIHIDNQAKSFIIRESKYFKDKGVFEAQIQLDSQLFPAAVKNPFTKEEEGSLSWYFEESLEFLLKRKLHSNRPGRVLPHTGNCFLSRCFQTNHYYKTPLTQKSSLMKGILRPQPTASQAE